MIVINERRSAGNFPRLYLTRVNINLLRPTSLSRRRARTAFATGYIRPFKALTCSICTISRRPLTAEVRVQYQANLCESYDERNGVGTGSFCSNTGVLISP